MQQLFIGLLDEPYFFVYLFKLLMYRTAPDPARIRHLVEVCLQLIGDFAEYPDRRKNIIAERVDQKILFHGFIVYPRHDIRLGDTYVNEHSPNLRTVEGAVNAEKYLPVGNIAPAAENAHIFLNKRQDISRNAVKYRRVSEVGVFKLPHIVGVFERHIFKGDPLRSAVYDKPHKIGIEKLMIIGAEAVMIEACEPVFIQPFEKIAYALHFDLAALHVVFHNNCNFPLGHSGTAESALDLGKVKLRPVEIQLKAVAVHLIVKDLRKFLQPVPEGSSAVLLHKAVYPQRLTVEFDVYLIQIRVVGQFGFYHFVTL